VSDGTTGDVLSTKLVNGTIHLNVCDGGRSTLRFFGERCTSAVIGLFPRRRTQQVRCREHRRATASFNSMVFVGMHARGKVGGDSCAMPLIMLDVSTGRTCLRGGDGNAFALAGKTVTDTAPTELA